ncbi:hypothetical protein [Salinisphaera aquimarina]|uniref:Uncharacterized protein n=1 Tax=Salinisphaera aquimarina TaxID=2094031 RepID=A0ABV7EJE0_9GAMM
MAARKKKVLWMGAGVVLLIVIALVGMRMAQGLDQSPPPMTTAKAAQLQSLEELAAAHDKFAGPFNPRKEQPTLRDSGRGAVGLFIKNTFFRIAGDIGFDTEQLSALLVPTDPPRPVTLDDPTSFVFQPLHGSVIMPASALTALFNQYLTDYPDTQMRNIKVSTQPNRLVVDGESSKIPGVWLPFHMEGSVHVEQGHLFVYAPDKIKVAKIEAKGLLSAINLQLSKLLQIDTQGAQLEGNNVVLDLNHSLPPPTQDVHIARMRIDDAGVHLDFSSQFNPAFPDPIVESDSYVLIQGGDIKTFRALITDARMQLIARGGGKLDTSLYNYRAQILDGFFDATPAGELVAYLGPYQPADYLPPAKPENGDAS